MDYRGRGRGRTQNIPGSCSPQGRGHSARNAPRERGRGGFAPQGQLHVVDGLPEDFGRRPRQPVLRGGSAGRWPQRGRRGRVDHRGDGPKNMKDEFHEGTRSETPIKGRLQRIADGEVRHSDRENTYIEHPMRIQTLRDLHLKEPHEIVMRLASPGCGLQPLIEQDHMKPQVLIILCEVLAKACTCNSNRQSLQHLMGSIKNSNFFQRSLPMYVCEMQFQIDSAACKSFHEHLHLEVVVDLLLAVIGIFPVSSINDAALLFSAIENSLRCLELAGHQGHPEMHSKLGQVRKVMESLLTQRTKSERQLRAPILKYDPDAQPPDDFRQLSIYPRYEDIHTTAEPFVRPNIVLGAYRDAESYLDTQFRLLREDFLRPLRVGITELLSVLPTLQGRQRQRRFDDIRVYHDACIVAPLCTPAGIVHKVQFDVESLRHVRWENSKRLIFGSLVCLSKDSFHTMLFASVANRCSEELKDGIVGLRFSKDSLPALVEVSPNDTFLMVETTAYFEAYRHVLEGLQEASEEDLPFKRYLVHCEVEVQHPAYLDTFLTPSYDFNPLLYKEEPACPVTTFSAINVLADSEWPSKEDMNLDSSQADALKLALTKELSIIQGPPGTGKTYVGLKIVQVLLHNEAAWQKNQPTPILVVCYTNHALDQFLEGISKFLTEGIVRVGGRSNSEAMKQFSLTNLRNSWDMRKNIPGHLRATFAVVSQNLKICRSKIEAGAIKLEAAKLAVLKETVLENCITNVHLAQFQRNMGWSKGSNVLNWLGIGTQPTESVANLLEETSAEYDVLEQLPSDDSDDAAERPEAANVQGNEPANGTANRRPVGRGAAMEDQLIGVMGEAELIQADRMLEEDRIIQMQNEAQRLAQLQRQIMAFNLQGGKEEAGGWQVKRDSKKEKKAIKRELRKQTCMTEEQAAAVKDIWNLSLRDRWQLYRFWVRKYEVILRRRIQVFEQEYQEGADRLADVRQEEDLTILRQASVIGMTTTGAAKYRHTLQKIQPKIVLVEEAAEVLEAHILTTLSAACQHLILIGDHQQLRPSATVYDLAKNFHLEVSLFERLVKNALPFIRLKYQHRMRPEIAALLVPHIYSNLENHESVLNYEDIKGITTNLYFVEHEEPEEEVSDSRSHQNQHEASFTVALCRYLILQGYAPHQITILTTYTGQLFALRRLMPRVFFQDVRVCVVDKYQGEENDIVLLSLVRSNRQGRAGFLKIDNRVCVALSRARKGLFCIGNARLLASVPLWGHILASMRSNGCVGEQLVLRCQMHPENEVLAGRQQDFLEAPEGGCKLPCDFRLACGHVCTRACHPYDRDHTAFKCMKPCEQKPCTLGHHCPKPCHEPCGDCEVPIMKIIPRCHHRQLVPCHVEPKDFVCQQQCDQFLSCGHPCQRCCGMACEAQCKQKISIVQPCGHNANVFCHQKESLPACPEKCGTMLDCGHLCTGTCASCYEGRFHLACTHSCSRTLVCGHTCSAACTRDCPPCQLCCQNRCRHSRCRRKCGEPCMPCVESCEWKCPHYNCERRCFEPCSRPPCNHPCDKKLVCGHTCIGLCGEPCPNLCRVCNADEVTEIFFGEEDQEMAQFIQLEDCKHVLEVGGLDHWMELKSNETEEREGNTNMEEMSTSTITIQLKVCPKCKTPIRQNLRYSNIVKTMLQNIEDVKEHVRGRNSDIKRERLQLLDKISKSQNIRLYCNTDGSTLEQMIRDASGLPELQACENRVGFLDQIGELRSKLYNFNSDSTKNVDQRLSEYIKWIIEPRSRLFNQELVELQTELLRLSFLSQLLCRWIIANHGENASEDVQQKAKATFRVLESTKPFTKSDELFVQNRMAELCKAMPLSGLCINESERLEILQAMHMGKGHWFKCPNGHIYAIGDCGGAMQTSTCPDCKARIGGESHLLDSENTLAPEMDGARFPAWSETANMLNYREAH
uniref:NFX1-type zinc finger-containing protein 1 isoform X1 n=1 Tax=Myxine glutinosa TaxID=7769 RepID=UPI00358FF488